MNAYFIHTFYNYLLTLCCNKAKYTFLSNLKSIFSDVHNLKCVTK